MKSLTYVIKSDWDKYKDYSSIITKANVRNVVTDKYDRYNHSGTLEHIPEGADEKMLGKTIWFKHTISQFLEDSRDYLMDGISDNVWRDFLGEKVNMLDTSNDNIRRYCVKPQDFKDNAICYEEEDGSVVPINNNIPYRHPKKNDRVGRIILFQNKKWEEGVGYIYQDTKEFKKGDKIIYWKNSGFPAELDPAEWIKRDGERICFTPYEDIFGWYNKDGDFNVTDNWTVFKPLDMDDEWAVNENGIYVPRNQNIQKGLGEVVYSKIWNKGSEMIFIRRPFLSLEIDGELHFACHKNDVVCDDELLTKVRNYAKKRPQFN